MTISLRRWATPCSRLASHAACCTSRAAPSSIPMALITWTFPTAMPKRPWLRVSAATERASGPSVSSRRQSRDRTRSVPWPRRSLPARDARGKEQTRKSGDQSTSNSIGHAPDLGELAQGRKIAIGLRRARRIGPIGVFEARGEHGRTEPVFKPGADPAQHGAAQVRQARHQSRRQTQRSASASEAYRRCGSTARDHRSEADRWKAPEEGDCSCSYTTKTSTSDPAQARKRRLQTASAVVTSFASRSGGISIAVPAPEIWRPGPSARFRAGERKTRTGGRGRRFSVTQIDQGVHVHVAAIGSSCRFRRFLRCRQARSGTCPPRGSWSDRPSCRRARRKSRGRSTFDWFRRSLGESPPCVAPPASQCLLVTVAGVDVDVAAVGLVGGVEVDVGCR